jgi:hypothetical protein
MEVGGLRRAKPLRFSLIIFKAFDVHFFNISLFSVGYWSIFAVLSVKEPLLI